MLQSNILNVVVGFFPTSAPIRNTYPRRVEMRPLDMPEPTLYEDELGRRHVSEHETWLQHLQCIPPTL